MIHPYSFYSSHMESSQCDGGDVSGVMGNSNMKVTLKCLPKNESRGHSV